MSTDTDTSTDGDAGDGDASTTAEEPDAQLTTREDYRHPYLSTVWAIGYGFGFCLFVAAYTLLPDVEGPGGMLMSVFTLAWIGTVTYIIGPESIRAARELKGGGDA